METNEGWTALHGTAEAGHLDVTKHLISQGAKVNVGDNEGCDCITHCCNQKGHIDVTEYSDQSRS